MDERVLPITETPSTQPCSGFLHRSQSIAVSRQQSLLESLVNSAFSSISAAVSSRVSRQQCLLESTSLSSPVPSPHLLCTCLPKPNCTCAFSLNARGDTARVSQKQSAACCVAACTSTRLTQTPMMPPAAHRSLRPQLEANNCSVVLCGAACAAAGHNLATASSSTAPAAACSGRLGGPL